MNEPPPARNLWDWLELLIHAAFLLLVIAVLIPAARPAFALFFFWILDTFGWGVTNV